MKFSLSPTLVVLVCVLASCAGGSGSSNGIEMILPPNPEGVLLEGDPSALALDVVRSMLPSPAPPGEIASGLMTTRLEGVFHPDATVGEINDALEERSMRIVSMQVGLPILVLKVPAVADTSEAVALAADLESTFAFVEVTHSLVPGESAAFDSGGSWLRDTPLEAGGWLGFQSDYLAALHLPAARNALELLDSQFGNGAPRIPVLVPEYYSATTDSRFTAQVPVAGSGDLVGGELGNRGYQALGIIGVDSEYVEFDPVQVSAAQSLILASLPMFGLTTVEMIFEVGRALEDVSLAYGDEQIILCTTMTYASGSFSDRSVLARAVDAWLWRNAVIDLSPDFIHISAAGDFGAETDLAKGASWTSPFNISAAFPDLEQLVLDNAAEDYADYLTITGANSPPPVGNLRSVGSSEPGAFGPSTFTSPGADLRVIGEGVVAPCNESSASCDGQVATLSSTRAAAAQVAGLFAFLRSLSPTRSTQDLLELVDLAWFSGYAPGVVDAYRAALGLDLSIADPRVRLAILDVAENSDVFTGLSNGQFDEHDLQVFLDGFQNATSLRFDLNGDGVTGGAGTSPFDLDINDPPLIGTVSENAEDGTISFDEQAVTDLEVLCYYAYSSLYVGDTAQRQALLSDCIAGGPKVFAQMATRTAEAQSQQFGATDNLNDLDQDSSQSLALYSGTVTSMVSGTTSAASDATWTSDFANDTEGNLTQITHSGRATASFVGLHSAGDVESHAAWDCAVSIANQAGTTYSVDMILTYTANLAPDTDADLLLFNGIEYRTVDLQDTDPPSGTLVIPATTFSFPTQIFARGRVSCDNSDDNSSGLGTLDWDLEVNVTAD